MPLGTDRERERERERERDLLGVIKASKLVSSPLRGRWNFDRLRYKKEDVLFISVRKRQW
jgi:hypothetical protein